MEYPKKIVQLKPGVEVTIRARYDEREKKFSFYVYSNEITLNGVKYRINLHVRKGSQWSDYEDGYTIVWGNSSFNRVDWVYSDKSPTPTPYDTMKKLVSEHFMNWDKADLDNFEAQAKKVFFANKFDDNVKKIKELEEEIDRIRQENKTIIDEFENKR